MPSELNGSVASALRLARTIATSSPNTTPRGTSKRTRMRVLSNVYGARAVTCVVAYPRPNGRGSGVGGDVASEASAAAARRRERQRTGTQSSGDLHTANRFLRFSPLTRRRVGTQARRRRSLADGFHTIVLDCFCARCRFFRGSPGQASRSYCRAHGEPNADRLRLRRRYWVVGRGGGTAHRLFAGVGLAGAPFFHRTGR